MNASISSGFSGPIDLRGSTFLRIKNTANVLVLDFPVGIDVANPRAAARHRRELFLFNGNVDAFYVHQYCLFVLRLLEDVDSLRKAITFTAACLPDWQLL